MAVSRRDFLQTGSAAAAVAALEGLLVPACKREDVPPEARNEEVHGVHQDPCPMSRCPSEPSSSWLSSERLHVPAGEIESW